jgi:hypothetical protein
LCAVLCVLYAYSPATTHSCQAQPADAPIGVVLWVHCSDRSIL